MVQFLKGIMILGTKKRVKLLFVLGGIAVLAAAGFIWLVLVVQPEVGQPTFRLDNIGQGKRNGTNFLVFRLTSLDHAHNYRLADAGYICTPSGNQFVGSLVFPSAAPVPVYGHWKWGTLPPATCLTNFFPSTFNTQIDFTIFAPMDNVWRLHVHPLQVLSHHQVFAWKTQRAWRYLKALNFSAIPGAWSGPSSVTLNYDTWSSPLTNAPEP
jgi:hypothetical protein